MAEHNQIEYAGLTDVGVRRSQNQDTFGVFLASDEDDWRRRGHFFVVADGMGGHAVGEMASDMAARIIPHTYQKYAPEGTAAALRKAFLEANSSIHTRGQQNREFAGMGTTTTALVLRPEGAWVAHVGDSRAYRIRDGLIQQLSFDHSLLWELARWQKVRPETLQGVPSNRILRSLGPEPLVEVDIEGQHPIRPGDIYLLCSDGLSGPLSDLEIGAVASTLPSDDACRLLIDLANLRGGPDNITCVIVRVCGKAGASDGGATNPAAPRSWAKAIPWPVTALLVGVTLAAGAAVLTYHKVPGDKIAFLLAAMSILTGVVGLSIRTLLQPRPTGVETWRPRTKVYRQASCKVERPLVDRLAQAEVGLKQWLQEKKLEADWKAHQDHFDAAARLLAAGDAAGAFREYCLAMRPLTAALQRHRSKDDGFPGFWEKTGNGNS